MKRTATREAAGKLPVRTVILIGLVCGVTTLLVALAVERFLPDWPRHRRGAIVGAWLVFSVSVSAGLGRMLRRNPHAP